MNGFYGQSIVEETKKINENYITEGEKSRKFFDRLIHGKPTSYGSYCKGSDIPESDVPKEYKNVMKEFIDKLSKRLEKEQNSSNYKELIKVFKESGKLDEDIKLKASSWKWNPNPWKFHRLTMYPGCFHEKWYKENEYSYQVGICPMYIYTTLFMIDIKNKETGYNYSFFKGFTDSVNDVSQEFKNNPLIDTIKININEVNGSVGHYPQVFIASKPFTVDK